MIKYGVNRRRRGKRQLAPQIFWCFGKKAKQQQKHTDIFRQLRWLLEFFFFLFRGLPGEGGGAAGFSVINYKDKQAVAVSSLMLKVTLELSPGALAARSLIRVCIFVQVARVCLSTPSWFSCAFETLTWNTKKRFRDVSQVDVWLRYQNMVTSQTGVEKLCFVAILQVPRDCVEVSWCTFTWTKLALWGTSAPRNYAEVRLFSEK